MKEYKLLDHTADIRVEVWGKTRKELFGNAVAAMFDVMVGWPSEDKKLFSADAIKPLEEKTAKINGNDLEDTLINFLREALYLFNGEKFITGSCEIIKFSNKELEARLTGDSFNNKKHLIKTEIKAVTYSGLKVKKVKAGWRARIIFDV